MKLTYTQLKDKILGCWNGKNIGGTLGAPYEGPRKINNVTFYDQAVLDNPPANDDLDLQILWLNAVERFGKFVDSHILSEYWLSYVLPNWVEYGTAKSNLKMGLKPPFSGNVENDYMNSNGAFIRSEIWACLCPGRPDLAVRYAYHDAIIDHGEEGLYAEIFCSAIESASFIESDTYKLIDIGLSYIPEDCDCAKAIKLVIEEYKKGTTWQDLRHILLSKVTCNFGIQDKIPEIRCAEYPPAKPGYDAPCHMAFLIVCWLYGSGDFEKSICIATNLGDDADCTAATIGSILGIILGNDALPEKWVKPLNNKIITKCINIMSPGITAPTTVEQLTDRVLGCIPAFLGDKCDINVKEDKYVVDTLGKDNLKFAKTKRLHLIDTNTMEQFYPYEMVRELSPFSELYQFPTFNAVLDYCGEKTISAGQSKKVILTITDNGILNEQRWAEIKVFANGLSVTKGKNTARAIQITHGYKAEIEIEFTAGEQFDSAKSEFYIDIQVSNRATTTVLKGFFINN